MPFLPQPSVTPVRVALVSNITNDRREVEIRDYETPITLGRASRSKGKQFEAQSNNALFDCPVVSRIHAELRMVPSESAEHPQLIISDSTSLHGTKVNGSPLKPGSTVTLQTGDVIKLGERVTRGDDAHEGVSLTFHRLQTPAPSYMSSTADVVFTGTQRGFRAPSFSEGSELDSNDDVSDGEYDPSSAKTTPEQSKMALSSQHAPITLDPDNANSDEDITFSHRVPESDFRPAFVTSQPPDFDGFSDAALGQDAHYSEEEDGLSAQGDLGEISDADSDEDSEIDHDDDVEYGCEHDNADDMSNPASDFSSQADPEADGAEPAHREPSVELGVFEKPVVGQPAAFSDLLDAAVWGAPSSKQYDPVRGSLPRVEQASALEPHRPTGRTTTTPFTYGYPGYNTYPATDFTTSGHWDVQHPMGSANYQLPGSPLYQTANSAYSFEAARTHSNPQPLFPMSIDAIVEPSLQASAEQISKTVSETINQTQTATEPGQGVAAGPSIDKADPSNAADSVSKRKRDEVDDAADTPCPPAKKPAPARRRLTPTMKRRSAIRKAVVSVTQATAFAAFGALGTVAFLSSPMAESLIQWLG